MAATDFFEQLVLDHALRQQSFSIQDWYVGFWLGDPTSAGLLTDEVSAADYQRKPVLWAADFTNANLIQWAAPIASWGTLTYVCVLNSPLKGSGNMCFYEARDPVVIDIGTPVNILVGTLAVTLV